MNLLPEHHNGFQPVAKLIEQIAEVAGYLWQKGWAERNAGNISVRITEMMNETDVAKYRHHTVPLPVETSMTNDEWFIISGAEKRMRHLNKNPLDNLLIIKINQNEKAGRVFPLSHNSLNIRPTSELGTHLLLHETLLGKRSSDRVVLHAHVTPVIAATHFREMTSETSLTGQLLRIHPEVATYLPAGIGFVPSLPPGSKEIASATKAAFLRHDIAVWEKHGLFAAGTSPDDAFDKMDIVAKTAEIWLQVHAIGK